jgi:hypothetical protein
MEAASQSAVWALAPVALESGCKQGVLQPNSMSKGLNRRAAEDWESRVIGDARPRDFGTLAIKVGHEANAELGIKTKRDSKCDIRLSYGPMSRP